MTVKRTLNINIHSLLKKIYFITRIKYYANYSPYKIVLENYTILFR